MPATSLAASPFLSPPSAARLRASCVWPIRSRTSPCRAATCACAASARSGCRTVPTVAHQFSSGCMHAWSDFGVHLSSIYKMGGKVSQHTYMPGRYMLLYPPQKGCAASRVASRNAELCAWAWPVRVGRRSASVGSASCVRCVRMCPSLLYSTACRAAEMPMLRRRIDLSFDWRAARCYL